MVPETLQKIEARIKAAEAMNAESRSELLNLLATLKAEIGGLPEAHKEQAQSIASFAEISTHEATRRDKNAELLDLSLKGLSTSVTGFETSHPRIVDVVNRICLTLSNLGI